MSAASERAKVNGKCPACGSGGLFVGSGGYLTCPWAECPNPSAPHDALTFTRAGSEREALLKAFGVSNGTQVWVEFQGGPDELLATIHSLGYTRQPRAEIQAEAWERGVDDEIRFAQEELRGAVPDIRNPYRIREGGERG